jgi:glycosyltransferase involved in cell wall biosynthesis
MRKKILEVIRQGQIGGGESHLLDLIYFLDKERFEPVCLSFTDGEMIRRLTQWGVKCHVIDSGKAFDLKVQRRVQRLVESEGIDLIHAHGSRAASNVLLAAKMTGRPLVYTVHGWSFHDDQSAMVKRLRGWSEKIICKGASRVICVSQSNADTGREVFGLQQADVIENGINLKVFSPEAAQGLRQQFGFSDDDFIVGFVARATKQKNPLLFLEAVEKAHQQNQRIKGLFVGEGDMDEAVDKLIADRRMSDFVCRSKFRTDVPNVLKTIDVYCLPSLWEGLSIALLEAMAMGKAIVATPTDGTKELLKDHHNGLVVPFDDAEKLAAAFQELFNDRSLQISCGRQAMLMVKERFDAQRVADSVMNIYDSFTKRKYRK